MAEPDDDGTAGRPSLIPADAGPPPPSAAVEPPPPPAGTEPAQSALPSSPSPLLRDALVTIGSRFGLAVLIFATDVLLANLLGPAAKGRFALVLLFSQLAALVVGWGMDAALGVVSGRDQESARRGFANALIWTAVAGGFAVVLSGLLYGLPTEARPRGPLATLIPNLSAAQFGYAALAIPAELFFTLGLYALLGRRRVIAFAGIRLLRRGLLVVGVAATAYIVRLDLDAALVLNLVALMMAAAAIAAVAVRDGSFSLRPSAPLLGEELRFGSRAIVGNLAERLQFRIDAFLVNGFIGVRATGIYSVTQGLAETLWYIPNALGTVMFSRAVDPDARADRIAALLTRTTIAVALVTAIPAFLLGPLVVPVIYSKDFAEAGDALRLILPGIVAYSVVAVLSRFIVGQGRPGTGTMIHLAGLIANVAINLVLIPRFGILGAAAASSISYGLTAFLTLLVFTRITGRGWGETLVIRRSDIRALLRATTALVDRARGRRRGPLVGLRGGGATAEVVLGEREPGEEP